MREFEFIRGIRSLSGSPRNPVIKAIGDDCAIIPYTKNSDMIITTDSFCEGAHFSRKYFSPFEIGAHAFAASVSDICAMGGRPLYALVNLAYPKKTPQNYIDTLYKGIMDYADNYCTDIIGGDTISAPQIMVSVTVVGEVERGKALRRDGARAGDSIFVTGTLGDSHAGLKILLKKSRTKLKAHEYMPVKKHILPQPAYMEGRVLLQSNLVNACMDVSDGIVSDIARICEESGTGAIIDVDSLPVSFSAHKTAQQFGEAVTDYALYGGEDFVLMFTAAKKNRKKLAGYLEENSLTAFEVGTITKKKGISLLKNGKLTKENGKKAWNHF